MCLQQVRTAICNEGYHAGVVEPILSFALSTSPLPSRYGRTPCPSAASLTMQNREGSGSRRRDEVIGNAQTVVEVAFALSPAIPIPMVLSILASAKVICDTASVRLHLFSLTLNLTRCTTKSIRYDKRISGEIADSVEFSMHTENTPIVLSFYSSKICT